MTSIHDKVRLAIHWVPAASLTVMIELPCSENHCQSCGDWQIVPIDDNNADK